MTGSLITIICLGFLQSSLGLKLATVQGTLKREACPPECDDPKYTEFEKLCKRPGVFLLKLGECAFQPPDSSGDCYAEEGEEPIECFNVIEDMAGPVLGGKGDPVMSTMTGKNFDLRAVGTFNLLTLTEKNSSHDVFRVDARIERAGASSGKHAAFSRCATYMKSLSFLGSWMSKNVTISTISNELKFFLDGETISPSQIESNTGIKMRSVLKQEVKFILEIADLKASISVGKHRQHAGKGSVEQQFVRFLNLQVTGVSSKMLQGHLTSHGLLGGDDFEFATHPPSECEVNRASHGSKQMQFSDSRDTESSSSMVFSCDIK